MNWFDKIKQVTTQKDNSPELKKGELKQILIRTANVTLPDFEFLEYKKSCYIFQRLRQANGLTVYETFHIVFTLKDRNFCCSVASRLNPKYIHINSYNTGLINPHKDLKVLRHNTGALKIEDAYYFHNGQVETTTNTITEILQDFKMYGHPFLDKQFYFLKSSKTFLAGLNFIENLTVDKAILKSDIENSVSSSKFGRIDNPIYEQLKQVMLSTLEGRVKEIRDSIPKATHELLEIYWTN